MSEQIYLRPLPGGGFVSIDITSRLTMRGRRYHGVVVVERRGDASRRRGHRPLVVAESDAKEIPALFEHLFLVAHSNVELAGRCLRRASAR